MKRRPEPTQTGNPHQLTIDQHVHSRACINRFADGDSRVFVRRRGATSFLTGADNNIFCAKRVWDQGSEANFFRDIEDRFQDEVDYVVANNKVNRHAAITAYVSIWQIRAELAEEPPEDVALNGLDTAPYLTKAEEELIEQKHGAYARGNVVPGRLSAWIKIRRDYDMAMAKLRDLRWGVLQAPPTRRFICPDRPAHVMYIPVTPTLALAGRLPDVVLSEEHVDQLNRESFGQARVFVFGHPDDKEYMPPEARPDAPASTPE